MKTRFSTYDIVCSVAELQRLVGLRVNQIYDIDNRTYLIRFTDKDAKVTLLLESGNRFHTTAFEWPKNSSPSGFSMKMRKHLKNKRLEHFRQLELDRIVDLQFGTGEAAYHVILELYDRGNIILTDHELTILNILRPHVEGEEMRFAVREKYPESRAKERSGEMSVDQVVAFMRQGKPGDTLKRVLNPLLDYGPAVIEHVLLSVGLADVRMADVEAAAVEDVAVEAKTSSKPNKKGKPVAEVKPKKKADTHRIFDFAKDVEPLMNALKLAEDMIREAKQGPSKGYIIQKRELRPTDDKPSATEPSDTDYFDHNIEFHPFLFAQYVNQQHKPMATFDACVDEFFSSLESQKIDLKTMQQERDALKKLSNVKRDHMKRLDELDKWQLLDRNKAELITRNQTLVDNAILAIRSAIASQLPWPEIQNLVKSAQANGDQVASSIRYLKLEKNHIALYLSDPYAEARKVATNGNDDENDSGSDADAGDGDTLEPTLIDIDLGLSAYANARHYYDNKRSAAAKQQRTLDASTKALKSAEHKTQQSLREMRKISSISKVRKQYWFEKFYWFISTENYLVIGGRDQQQNELIVKRYMRATDIYVHAEIQGASSVVIRNPSEAEVPPKTLLEAGTMAISYSVAWDAKVVTNAYWVHSQQVSKTAPTGEYLGTGSFMIRGRKNFLPPCNLILGMSFLFKLEDESVARHKGERRVRTFEGEDEGLGDGLEAVRIGEGPAMEAIDEEIQLLDSDDEPDPEPSKVDTGSAAIEKDNEDKDVEEDDDDDDNQFPDTHVTIEHHTGRVSVQPDPLVQRLTSISSMRSSVDDSIELGDNQPYIIHTGVQAKIKQQKKDRDARKGKKAAAKVPAAAQTSADDGAAGSKPSAGPKRGQKSKLKKIREKYGDQDEEEKRIRMEILKSAGTHKLAPVVEAAAAEEEQYAGKKPPSKFDVLQKKAQQSAENNDDDEAADDVGGTAYAAEVDMLDSLTGCPVDEDELLFGVPVIAPYQALTNYKFKVKLTPGTGKRGKAAQTALAMFVRDKTCSQREKDLLKSVKDETIARNMPGKVKLSAPQLHRGKK